MVQKNEEDKFNEIDKKKDVEIFLRAWEEHRRTGVSCTSVLCPTCNTPICFTILNSSVTTHNCHCGRFAGSLKGL